ncbi:MAG: response regulator, partial [Proteobacteria bacterium]|nr:response regulator [Pseudomonadota bacterium]
EQEKKILQEQLFRASKMEAIGLMAGGVAHDLNNILTGITGYPELLLLQLPEDSELRKPIEEIKKSGERAAAVVADLLTVARGVASVRTAASLKTLVTEYLDSPEHHHLCSLCPQVMCYHTLADDLPDISCSPIHIKKCIMNLVINAAEAIGDSGSIILKTSSIVPDMQWARENELEQKEYVILTVTDTGPGISKESVEHIFEPFYTKKVMGRSGTGLGLTVVWNTMKDHGGKIFVESSNRGTCFQLYFPVSKEKEVIQIETEKTEKIIGNGEHILIVDDEPQVRDIAGQMLQSQGYKVDSVRSGELAVEFVRKKSVDLIVIDMLMEPGMSGRRTYEEIIELYPDQKAIIASGFSENDDVQMTLQLGAGGFIKKPYSMNQLGLAVKEALQG